MSTVPPASSSTSQIPHAASLGLVEVRIQIRRLIASFIILAAGICAGISTLSPWWTLTVSGGTITGSLSFLPGNSYTSSANGSTASFLYANQGLGPVGVLYEGILALAIVLMILALLAAFIGIAASLGRISNATRYYTIRNLVIVLIIISLFLVIIVPVLQPTLFHNSNPSGICMANGGVQTPCNSFWGSVTSDGEKLNWGSDVGWYLAIATVVLLFVGTFVWRSAYSETWGRATTSVPISVVGSAGSYASSGGPQYQPTAALGSVSAPAVQLQSASPAERYCPSCGTGNARAFAFCQKCGMALPPPP
jgi:hypothetical protein